MKVFWMLMQRAGIGYMGMNHLVLMSEERSKVLREFLRQGRPEDMWIETDDGKVRQYVKGSEQAR